MKYLQDTPFLTEVIKQKLKTTYAKIIVLDKHELPIDSIEGRITAGSLNINGSSAVRRTGSLTFVASEKEDMSITDVKHLLSMNKRIKILLGMDNNVDSHYDSRIWFPLGTYVITQPAISHSNGGVTINLSFKDKMCLLNGECGGGLPAAVILNTYTQMFKIEEVDRLPDYPSETVIYIYTTTDENNNSKTTYWRYSLSQGWQEGTAAWVDINNATSLVNIGEERSQRVFDIIQTLVANYGEQDIAKIIINDVPLEIKQIVRFVGNGTLYHDTITGYYSTNEKDPAIVKASQVEGRLAKYGYNEDVGYVYTDFTYPGELTTGLSDNVANTLDKIAKTLGNFEYFFDLDGNFVFQEIKNYLNTAHSTAITNEDKTDYSILNFSNYKANFNNSPKSVFTFDEDNFLISSYSNTPNFLNIKNDYHIWGENKNGNSTKVIHYHLAIKEKPICENKYLVVFNNDGSLRLATAKDKVSKKVVEIQTFFTPDNEPYEAQVYLTGNEFSIYSPDESTAELDDYIAKVDGDTEVGLETLSTTEGDMFLYQPNDWRVELYMQGLQKQALGLRPSLDEQEVLDFLPIIYDFKKQQYKEHILNNPNELIYFIDYLEPSKDLHDYSVDIIGRRTYSYQQDKINKIYNRDIPNYIIINGGGTTAEINTIQDKCKKAGQPYSIVSESVFDALAMQTVGYAAKETMREMLYQYTNYNEQVSLQAVPIYFLDVNTRISIYDAASNIYGDYIIKSFSMPLTPSGTMSITASRAQERI